MATENAVKIGVGTSNDTLATQHLEHRRSEGRSSDGIASVCQKLHEDDAGKKQVAEFVPEAVFAERVPDPTQVREECLVSAGLVAEAPGPIRKKLTRDQIDPMEGAPEALAERCLQR